MLLSFDVISPYNDDKTAKITISSDMTFTAYFEEFQEWKLVKLFKITRWRDVNEKPKESAVLCTGEMIDNIFVGDNRTRTVDKSKDGYYHLMVSPSFIESMFIEYGEESPMCEVLS